jgi:hypothetical protein
MTAGDIVDIDILLAWGNRLTLAPVRMETERHEHRQTEQTEQPKASGSREGRKVMRWQVNVTLLMALLVALVGALGGCGSSSTARTVEPFPPRANWQQVDAKGYFTFWIPGDLMEEHLQGVDSYVGSWFSPAMRVDFDYGRYSAPIDVSSLPKPVTLMQDDSSGRAGTIVTYANASRNPVAQLYVGDIDGVNRLSMTAVGFEGTEASIPLLVLQSVRFPLTA